MVTHLLFTIYTIGDCKGSSAVKKITGLSDVHFTYHKWGFNVVGETKALGGFPYVVL